MPVEPRLTVLDSGLRVVTESVPHTRSAAVGFFVETGSVDEDPATLGVSHFLEHLCFKGARGRTGTELARSIEAVGGVFNAQTAWTDTSFYAYLPARHLDAALEVLSATVWEPHLATDDVEAERAVILNELRMYDDAPGSVVADAFHAALWPDHPYGWPIGGTAASVAAITPDLVRDTHAAAYVPANVVVAAAGPIDHDAFVAAVAALAPDDRRPAPTRALGAPGAPVERSFTARDTEQAHARLGWRSRLTQADRHRAAVLFEALSGGMSTRLFVELRERRSLVYSAHAGHVFVGDDGFVAVGLSTGPDQAAEAVALATDVVRGAALDGLDDAELDAAREAVRGAAEMRFEHAPARMMRLARAVRRDELIPLDVMLDAVAAVSHDDLADLGPRLFASPQVTAVLAPAGTALDAAG